MMIYVTALALTVLPLSDAAVRLPTALVGVVTSCCCWSLRPDVTAAVDARSWRRIAWRCRRAGSFIAGSH